MFKGICNGSYFNFPSLSHKIFLFLVFILSCFFFFRNSRQKRQENMQYKVQSFGKKRGLCMLSRFLSGPLIILLTLLNSYNLITENLCEVHFLVLKRAHVCLLPCPCLSKMVSGVHPVPCQGIKDISFIRNRDCCVIFLYCICICCFHHTFYQCSRNRMLGRINFVFGGTSLSFFCDALMQFEQNNIFIEGSWKRPAPRIFFFSVDTTK